jgi:hypothetical protein
MNPEILPENGIKMDVDGMKYTYYPRCPFAGGKAGLVYPDVLCTHTNRKYPVCGANHLGNGITIDCPI